MNLQDKINKLKYSLNLDILNLRDIQRQINEIQNFKEEQNYDYLQGLLYPEKSQGIRIPSQIPQPTSCFQWKSSFMLTTNENGCLFFYYNPFFLYDESTIGKIFSARKPIGTIEQYYFAQYLSSFWFTDGRLLDGIYKDTPTLYCVDIKQGIPNLYDTYRLVSASLVMKYVGILEEAQGVVGGGIDFTDFNLIGGKQYVYNNQPYDPSHIMIKFRTKDFNSFTFFDNIRHLTYSTENNVLEGLRLLYFPIDNKSDQFIKIFNGDGGTGFWKKNDLSFIPSIDQYRPGFNWVGYVQNGPPSSKYKLDIVCNYEAVPRAEYLNYIPISTRLYYLPWSKRKTILDELKNHAIQKISNIYI